jgi:hypothetical protein
MNIDVICNVYHFSNREKQLLPHFIRHYVNKLNLNILILTDYKNTELKNYCDQNQVDCEYFNFSYDEVCGLQDSDRINKTKNKRGNWYIPVDLDEFIDFYSTEHVLQMIESCIKTNKKYVAGKLLDRFVTKNSIKDSIDLDSPLSNQFPHSEYFTKNVMGGCINKICLCSPELSIGAGHHNVLHQHNIIYKNTNYNPMVNHFKWFENILELEKRKMQLRKNKKSRYNKEQENLLKHFFYA